MSSQPRTYPPHDTGRDDEYPTETFRSVVDSVEPSDDREREPREQAPAASDDDPPTQVMAAFREDIDPAVAETSLFDAYTGSDDEHDTAVFARYRDGDPDPRAAAPRRAEPGPETGPGAEPRRVPGSLPEQVRGRAERDDEPHTEQFAAYRDDSAAPPVPPVPSMPPVVPPIPPLPAVPLSTDGTRATGGMAAFAAAGATATPDAPAAPGQEGVGSAGVGSDGLTGSGPADVAAQVAPAALADAPVEDADAEPVLDKRAARQAERLAKAEAKAAAKAEKSAAKAGKKAAKGGEDVGPDDEVVGRTDAVSADATSAAVSADTASAVTSTDASTDTASAAVSTDTASAAASPVTGAAGTGAAVTGALAAGAVAAGSATTISPDNVTTGEIPAATLTESTAETPVQAPVEAEGPQNDEDEPETTAARRKVPVLIVIALLLVAAAGAGAAVWFRGHVVDAGQQRPSSNLALLDQSATAEAVDQVSRAVEAIYSYDASSLDADEAKALSMINGSYASEFKQNFATVRALPPNQRASLSSKVVAAGVITLTERRASLLLMLDQVGRQADKPEPVKAAVRLSVTAQRVDGQWKVSGVNQK